MEAKQKAKELVDEFLFADIYFTDKKEGAMLNAKECALIACDEIINQFNEGSNNLWASGKIDYWQSVKQEVETL